MITQPKSKNFSLNSYIIKSSYRTFNHLLSCPEDKSHSLAFVKLDSSTDITPCSKLYTLNDPVDDLSSYYQLTQNLSPEHQILPAWYPHHCLAMGTDHFIPYLRHLSEVAEIKIFNLESLFVTLSVRLDYFNHWKCQVAFYETSLNLTPPPSEQQVDLILQKALSGEPLDDQDITQYQTLLLMFLQEQYKQRGWTHSKIYHDSLITPNF